jgi:DNA-binding transcriptional ArsR family regulator
MENNISIFAALADPVRLQIVEAMRTGECSVGDIVDRVQIRQSGVSRHLKILFEAGIVQMRPDAQRRIYSIRREAFDQLEAWVMAYRRHWDARLDRLGRQIAVRQARKTESKE